VPAECTRTCHSTEDITHRTLCCRTDIRIENIVNSLVLFRIMSHLSYKYWCIGDIRNYVIVYFFTARGACAFSKINKVLKYCGF